MLDGRSDLFSLGATLYHLAMGRADTSRVFDPEELPESCSILQPLLSALLRPNRDKRPADVQAVLRILDQLQQGSPQVAGRPAAALKSGSDPQPPMPPEPPGTAKPRLLVAPFDLAAAKAAQAALAKQLQQPEEWTNTIGMKFRLIPAGTFLMGSPEGKGYDAERPQHKVTITRAFRLAIHTVTQSQWQQVMGTTPWKGQGYVKEGSDVAATYVSWDDAVAFCKRLSEQEGRRYRLPMEAEWEWCCRAGTTTEYSFGDDERQLDKYAWFKSNAWDKGEKYAHRVGQKQANPFGLYDMHGNVWEWCQDWKDNGYYAQSPPEDPPGPSSGSSRVFRGGGWSNIPIHLRSSNRGGYPPGNRLINVSIRVLLESE
jgi:formylglycine-generating enzyme required for sulfatase activity